jgi:hypothetical protein
LRTSVNAKWHTGFGVGRLFDCVPKSLFIIGLLYFPIWIIGIRRNNSAIISPGYKPGNHFTIIFTDPRRLWIKIITNQQESLFHKVILWRNNAPKWGPHLYISYAVYLLILDTFVTFSEDFAKKDFLQPFELLSNKHRINHVVSAFTMTIVFYHGWYCSWKGDHQNHMKVFARWWNCFHIKIAAKNVRPLSVSHF